MKQRVLLGLLLVVALVAWALPAAADEEPVVAGEPVIPPGIAKIAAAIAGVFDTVVDEITGAGDPGGWITEEGVLALHANGIGFGAIYRLALLAWAQGRTVEELLAERATADEDGDAGLGIGRLTRDLDEAVLALIVNLPRNLGQAIAAGHRPTHAGQGNNGHHGNPHGDDPRGGPIPLTGDD